MQDVQEFKSEERKIKQIAQQSYDDALKFYYYPSLPTPNLIFDYTKKTGFFIDFNSYQITLNLANTHDIILTDEFYDYFFSLSLHEISHYVYCPYDNYTNMLLLNAVIEAKIHPFFAPIIVNVFSDLLIDYKNHHFYPKIMEWELKKHLSENQKPEQFKQASKLWKVLIHCYELLWNIKLLNDDNPDTQIDEICQKISKIIKNSIDEENNWLKDIKKTASILKPILKEECSLKDNVSTPFPAESGRNSGKEKNSMFPANPIQLPEDVEDFFGELTQTKDFNKVKNRDSEELPESQDKNPDIKQDLENFAKDHDFGNFQAISQLYGFNDSIEKLAIWYRSQARNLLSFEITTQKPGGSIPVSVEKWRIGDPLEELDVLQSLISSPKLIPNVTTKKWNRLIGPGIKIKEQLPDLMIVLDSSGSMNWDFNKKKISGKYHVALLASFAALHYALSQGSYVAVINFSEKTHFTEWTNDFRSLERQLLNYQGSGTVLPSRKMLNLAKRADTRSCVVVITDFEIQNWDDAYTDFLNLLEMGNMLICFFIDGDEDDLENPSLRELNERGAKFYCVNRKKDLVGLVVREVNSLYHRK